MSATLPDEWELFRGDDLPVAFRMIQANNEPLPLAGWTGVATLKAAGALVAERPVAVDPSDARVSVMFSESDTDKIPRGAQRGEVRVRLTSPAGDTRTWLLVPLAFR